uniref:Uncharacterized protein n=1 Tax=Solanum tuberosum TaxID=4113 RepID=M1DPI0_SOLTU
MKVQKLDYEKGMEVVTRSGKVWVILRCLEKFREQPRGFGNHDVDRFCVTKNEGDAGIFGEGSRPLDSASIRLGKPNFVRLFFTILQGWSPGHFGEISHALGDAPMLFSVPDLDRLAVRLGTVAVWLSQRVASYQAKEQGKDTTGQKGTNKPKKRIRAILVTAKTTQQFAESLFRPHNFTVHHF